MRETRGDESTVRTMAWAWRVATALALTHVAVAVTLVYLRPTADAGLREASAGDIGTVELIVVPEDEPWLAALAAPAAAKLRAGDEPPALLALPYSPTEETRVFLEQLSPTRTLVLASSRRTAPVRCAEGGQLLLLVASRFDATAGMSLAVRFWQNIDTVVVADARDPAAVISGSAFAAHAEAPFIPVESAEGWRMLGAALAKGRVERAVGRACTSVARALTSDAGQGLRAG